MVSKLKKDGTQIKKLNVKIGTKIIEMKNWMNLEFFGAKWKRSREKVTMQWYESGRIF